MKKVDNDLSDQLGAEGYAKPKKTLKYAQSIEDDVAEALIEETDYFVKEAEKAVDLEAFAEDIWPRVKAQGRAERKAHDGIYGAVFLFLCRSSSGTTLRRPTRN